LQSVPGLNTADEVEAFVLLVRDLIAEAREAADGGGLSADEELFLRDAAAYQVQAAADILKHDRHLGFDILARLFRLGTVPAPHGRYDGELVAMSTGLLSDPFFEWITRLYLPWLGKTFDASDNSGDNVFVDNAWSKATGKLGWPEYRVKSDDPPGTVRVFPFRTHPGPALEDAGIDVLKMDYSSPLNPLPVRRMVDELVELPGGFCLGKVHMRGLREFRRIAYFGLVPAPSGPSEQS
jgi:hypothetical protein